MTSGAASQAADTGDAEELFLSPDRVPAGVPELVRLHGPALSRQRRTFALVVLVIPVTGSAAAVALLPWLQPSWLDALLFATFYVVTMLGVEIGFHRLFSHRAFEATPLVRAGLAIAACMAVQGPVMYWVAHHRRHHQRTDVDGDPHSPQLHDGRLGSRLRAFGHAHIGWIFAAERASPGVYARDVLRDRTLLAIDRSYYVWMVASFVAPGVIAGLLTWSATAALTGSLWAGFVRVLVVQQATYAVNSVAHLWGSQPFQTGDASRNLAWLSPLSAGGFLHNAHHAFPSSAKNSARWYELDTGWYFIRALQAFGLVSKPRVPPAARLEAKRLTPHAPPSVAANSPPTRSKVNR